MYHAQRTVLAFLIFSASVPLFSTKASAQDACEQISEYLTQCQSEICELSLNPQICIEALDDAIYQVGASEPAECELGLQITEMSCRAFVEMALQSLMDAQARDAEAELYSLASMVDTFYLMNNRRPAALDELTQDLGRGVVMEMIPLDPWSNAYQYQLEEDGEFSLFSPGPDGIPETADDIAYSQP